MRDPFRSEVAIGDGRLASTVRSGRRRIPVTRCRPPGGTGRVSAPLWRAAGWTTTGAGAVGIVLPLVPTTPFLILAAAAFARRSARARLARTSPLVRAVHRRVGAAPRHSAPCETAGLRGDGRLSRPLARAVGAARRRRRAGDLPRPRCRLKRDAPGRAGIVSMDGGRPRPSNRSHPSPDPAPAGRRAGNPASAAYDLRRQRPTALLFADLPRGVDPHGVTGAGVIPWCSD